MLTARAGTRAPFGRLAPRAWYERLAAAAIAVGLAHLLWLAGGQGLTGHAALLNNLAYFPVDLAWVVLSFAAATRPALSARSRLAWRLLALAGLACWLGDLAWDYRVFIQGQPPFPSPADIGYLAIYPLMTAGLLAFPLMPRSRLEWGELALDLALVLVGGAMLAWHFVLAPLADAADGTLATVLSLGYPVANLGLLFGAAALALGRARPEVRPVVRPLAVGLALALIGSLLFSALALQDGYGATGSPDPFWVLARLLAVVAATIQLRAAEAPRPAAADDAPRRWPNPIPFAAVLVAVGLTLWANGWGEAGAPHAALARGSALLTLLVVLRLLLTLRENRRLLVAARRDLERRRALLHAARCVAATADPDDLLALLLDEAQAMFDAASGSVYRWDAAQQEPVLVRSRTVLPPADAQRLGSRGIAGQAARSRAAVIANDYPRSAHALPEAVAAGVQASMAVPLLHEGRLLGVLRVGSYTPGARYTRADAEGLELLAGLVAATLAGLERARVEAVTLTARELAHRINNHLAVPLGALDLLLQEPGLPPHLAPLLRDGATGLTAASADVADLLRLVRFATKQTPVGPALDLERSLQPDGAESAISPRPSSGRAPGAAAPPARR